MAIIHIAGRKETIRVTNERGRQIKLNRFGDDFHSKVDPNDDLDLGDVWAGKYGQIRAVEIEVEIPKTIKVQEWEREPTREERERGRELIAKARKNLEKQKLIKTKNI